MRSMMGLVLLTFSLAGCGGGDSSPAAGDSPDAPPAASSFTPSGVFDGCDSSQTLAKVCQLYGGAKPANYATLPASGCGGDPSHQTTSCPSGQAGVCEAPPVSGITTYIYYYETAAASAEKIGCETVGGTWH